jgi:DNA-binding Xre family transcriptional regulator
VYNSLTLVKEGSRMSVSYKKLFKLLIDRGMKKKDLQKAADISPASVSKLAKDENVSLDVLAKVCLALNVDFGDIMEIVRTETT